MKMHSEFSSWKLKKYNGNREGNTIVISEMHMPEFCKMKATLMTILARILSAIIFIYTVSNSNLKNYFLIPLF